MESGLFLDVVVGKGSAVFQLFTGKDQTLLVWWDTFLVLQITILESGFYFIFRIFSQHFAQKVFFLSKMKIFAKKYIFCQK